MEKKVGRVCSIFLLCVLYCAGRGGEEVNRPRDPRDACGYSHKQGEFIPVELNTIVLPEVKSRG